MDQVEQDLVVQRRQRELQLEQARYEARLAQRQYDAVDPGNRLVAAEWERRWNEKLERVRIVPNHRSHILIPTPLADNSSYSGHAVATRRVRS